MFTKSFARTVKCLVLAMVLLSSCNALKEEINDIKTEIAEIKDALSALQDAYNSGKIISSVTALEGEAAGGWIITFSDNTTIKVTNGKDGQNGADGANGKDGADGADGKDGAEGVTPYLKINEDNNWSVSYDGGVTYSLILDSNGDPIPATGDSVRVVVNDEGYYVIEIYVSGTDEVVDSITTPYSSNPQTIIQSIVEDTVNNTISITSYKP